MRVGYQGEPQSYSHRTAEELFPGEALIGFPTFAACFEALAQSEVDRLVLPVENSTTGPIPEVAERLVDFEVVAERRVSVRHALLGPVGSRIDDVERVLSHPQALAQAENTLRDRGWEAVPADDTAGAARRVAERADPSLGALAPPEAAETYGLEVLACDVIDRPDNATRFAVVRRPG